VKLEIAGILSQFCIHRYTASRVSSRFEFLGEDQCLEQVCGNLESSGMHPQKIYEFEVPQEAIW